MFRYSKLANVILFVVLAIALLGAASCSQALSSTVQAPPASSTEPTSKPAVTDEAAPAGSVEPAPEAPSPKTVETTPGQSIYDVDIAQYQLAVDGLVNNPLVLTYEALTKYPSVTQEAELVCPGVFEYSANWTGVPVTTLLAEAGIEPQASQVVFHSWDGYKSVLPLKEVQQEGVFIAYLINGQALKRDDGYPLRLVLKGRVATCG